MKNPYLVGAAALGMPPVSAQPRLSDLPLWQKATLAITTLAAVVTIGGFVAKMMRS